MLLGVERSLLASVMMMHGTGGKMAFDKAIAHGKEKRKPYRGSKAFDRSCRNHGGCGWCESSRLYKRRRDEAAAQEQIDEYEITER